MFVTPELFENWLQKTKHAYHYAGIKYMRKRWKLREDPYFGLWVEDTGFGCDCFFRFFKNGNPAMLNRETMQKHLNSAKKHRELAAKEDFSMDEMEKAMQVMEELG